MSKECIYFTYEGAMREVRRWGGNLKYVRPDLITTELALEAVISRGWALEYVPAHLQTSKVIEIALKDCPHAKQYIKTKGLMMEALEEALGE